MPANNGTGPMGQGPKTGRGLGKCSGNKTADVVNYPGRGTGRGMGRGRGMGMCCVNSGNAADEKACLQNRIDAMQKRIDELDK